MRVLCIGDVVGKGGREHVRKVLPKVKRDKQIDVCVVNGENSAQGNGITPETAQFLFDSGADVITGGNHTFRYREIYEMLDENAFLLRPYNYPKGCVGHGFCTIDKGKYQVTVINLQGAVFMDPIGNPFEYLDRALEEAGNPKICIVDFHAEATAEKKALAIYGDGRISALFGTHTHVQTADEQLLPSQTGYITDVGMAGPFYSVIGSKPSGPIDRMRIGMPTRFTPEEGPCCMDGIIFTIDEATGRTQSVERIQIS
ncbi:MAG: TIGR00282 family metallophosphoesterase [Clostridia bacterium]|nr:TIGR00282 family metallophosphoesterase [Clostridia bacterium]